MANDDQRSSWWRIGVTRILFDLMMAEDAKALKDFAARRFDQEGLSLEDFPGPDAGADLDVFWWQNSAVAAAVTASPGTFAVTPWIVGADLVWTEAPAFDQPGLVKCPPVPTERELASVTCAAPSGVSSNSTPIELPIAPSAPSTTSGSHSMTAWDPPASRPSPRCSLVSSPKSAPICTVPPR